MTSFLLQNIIAPKKEIPYSLFLRILPEGWAEFVSTPAPAWDRGRYGGLFWVNRDGRWRHLPGSAYYMSGAGGQHVIIVPTHDLVVVRLGHRRGQRAGPRRSTWPWVS
ncbi:hypothetical protein MYX84_13385 [Acidobacteria bacterium AH-259-O06]|nr:hypothetical protein [Acidobacteria bacterium AH-259-O06]